MYHLQNSAQAVISQSCDSYAMQKPCAAKSVKQASEAVRSMSSDIGSSAAMAIENDVMMVILIDGWETKIGINH